jgi:hypothetical protein
MAGFGALAQAQHPFTAVPVMVFDLLQCLYGNRAQVFIRVVAKPFVLQEIKCIVEKLPGDRGPEIAIGLLDQKVIQVFMFVAQHGQGILIRLLTGQGSDVLEDESRLANEIERNIGHGDVLLEDGTVAAPLPQSLAKDEGAVGEMEEVLNFGFHDGIKVMDD